MSKEKRAQYFEPVEITIFRGDLDIINFLKLTFKHPWTDAQIIHRIMTRSATWGEMQRWMEYILIKLEEIGEER